MITINMTEGEDNQAIFLFKLTSYSLPSAGSVTYRWCSSHNKDLSLSGNTWYGNSLSLDSFTDLISSVDFEAGGSVANNNPFGFGIRRFAPVSDVDGFFNEFYPATSGNNLVGSILDVGIVWDTVNLVDETDITWLEKYKVKSYSYDMGMLSVICEELDDFEKVILPPYRIQDDLNDGAVSYIEKISDTVILNNKIPIIYGDFYLDETDDSLSNHFLNSNNTLKTPAPVILVDTETLKHVISCHKLYDVPYGALYGWYMWQYISGIDTFMRIYSEEPSNTDGTNSIINSNITMAVAPEYYVYGKIIIKMMSLDYAISEISSVNNVKDYDETNYNTLTHGTKLAMMVGRNCGNIGVFNRTSGVGKIYFVISSDDANSRSYTIDYWGRENGETASSPTTSTVSGTTATLVNHSFGSAPIALKPSDIVENFTFTLKNNDADSGDDIRVYGAYLLFENLDVATISVNPDHYGFDVDGDSWYSGG